MPPDYTNNSASTHIHYSESDEVADTDYAEIVCRALSQLLAKVRPLMYQEKQHANTLVGRLEISSLVRDRGGETAIRGISFDNHRDLHEVERLSDNLMERLLALPLDVPGTANLKDLPISLKAVMELETQHLLLSSALCASKPPFTRIYMDSLHSKSVYFVSLQTPSSGCMFRLTLIQLPPQNTLLPRGY
jgi:hypothetical protein